MATPLTSSLERALQNAANIFTSAMFRRTSGSDYPKTNSNFNRMVYSIQGATSVRPPVTGAGKSWIDIVIDLKKAPYAAAYEWGKDEPYTIEPKNALAIMFPKSRWPQYVPPPPAPDVFVFSSVVHKSIKARPFLKPTANEVRSQITQAIGRAFVESYRLNFGGTIIIK